MHKATIAIQDAVTETIFIEVEKNNNVDKNQSQPFSATADYKLMKDSALFSVYADDTYRDRRTPIQSVRRL